MLPSASQLQKCSSPVWLPWELLATDFLKHHLLLLIYMNQLRMMVCSQARVHLNMPPDLYQPINLCRFFILYSLYWHYI